MLSKNIFDNWCNCSVGLAFIREMKAWRGLTKEAFPVVYTETRQVFTKNGGIEAALKDFDSIRPTNVRVIETLDGVCMHVTHLEQQERMYCIHTVPFKFLIDSKILITFLAVYKFEFKHTCKTFNSSTIFLL